MTTHVSPNMGKKLNNHATCNVLGGCFKDNWVFHPFFFCMYNDCIVLGVLYREKMKKEGKIALIEIRWFCFLLVFGFLPMVSFLVGQTPRYTLLWQ